MSAPARPDMPERLRQIIELAADGVPDKDIAVQLSISIHTVDAHWRRLRERYEASSRAEAIAKYLREKHEAVVAALEREIEDRKTIEERLREVNDRLSRTLAERDAISAKLIDAYSRAEWKDSEERDRLLRLEMAVEASGTIVYEGECGGAWRKFWVTQNFSQLGHAPADFVTGALRVSDWMIGNDVMSNYVQFDHAVRRGGIGFTSYYRFKTANGELRWIRDRMTLVRDESGQVVRYFGAGTDVTDLMSHLDPGAITEYATED